LQQVHLLLSILKSSLLPSTNFTVTEKEVLSIVETLKMILGCPELYICTDHKNLTYPMLTTQCMLHWCLYLEEYNPIFHYIKGSSHTMSDAFSRLPAHGADHELHESMPFMVCVAIKIYTICTLSTRPYLLLPPYLPF